jgi:hypothetical protein
MTFVKLSLGLLSAFSIWYASSEMAMFLVPIVCLCVCMCVLQFTSCRIVSLSKQSESWQFKLDYLGVESIS